jgi:PAT family beta-lactamase induction signal transducer AmpG
MLTTAMGLGHALWIFGTLQIVSNLGYVWVANAGVDRIIMYGAMGFESLTSGMGTGAFGVLLLRMTQKQFSATQYALFSSLFALPRILAGPVTGVLVDAMGWSDFFLLTMAFGIPGMIMLQRFSPLGVRDPKIELPIESEPRVLMRSELWARALTGALVTFVLSAVTMALLNAVKLYHTDQREFDFFSALLRLLGPVRLSDWLLLFGVALFSALIGLAVAATAVARSRRAN